MELLSLLNHEKEEDKARHNSTKKKLHEAAMKGSVPSLLQILHEDPLIFRHTPPSSAYSPLHVAALLGYLDFSRELLRRNPELAGSPCPGGSTPLHLASAKGYVEIVKELTLVNPDLCFAFDLDGRSPIHLAAIKGRVGVLTELVRVRPEATRVLTQGGESCLHLCVKYNRLEALKAVVGSLNKEDEFVNWKDGGGNTVLHLAVAKKQLEDLVNEKGKGKVKLRRWAARSVVNFLLATDVFRTNRRLTCTGTYIVLVTHSTQHNVQICAFQNQGSLSLLRMISQPCSGKSLRCPPMLRFLVVQTPVPY
ncbi:hypothetical protein Acr_10g0005480 [Actinidia rufa]|uniref:Ankyrin repeat family protein n=1 Tax=Actinidia rufa TaxID=165716 RepID=A0A7J0F977_9ERIC|nr:hypothetical protein Acr_10g0005480 [Actinidia rufa]